MQENEKLIQYNQQLMPMISRAKAELIAEKFTPLVIAKNDFLLQEGKISNHSYFLEEGFVRAFTFDFEGNDVTTNIFTKNSFANDFVSFFRRMPSQENIQAVTDCKVWCITFEEVQTYFHSIPEFREFGRLLLISNYATLKTRMLSMIRMTAEQRYAHLIASNPEIFQYIPLKQIASYLGVTDTSLSRIRANFAKK